MDTPVPPTNTPTDTPTDTPVPPTNTPTNTPTDTPAPPTPTITDTPTRTLVPPTNTPTRTPAITCPETLGFWKFNTNLWPVESLTIGGVTYTKAQLLDILDTSALGDATYILAQDLIPTLLNQASGIDTTAVNQTIADAQAFLAAHPLGSNPPNPARQEAIDLAATLDAFNNGC